MRRRPSKQPAACSPDQVKSYNHYIMRKRLINEVSKNVSSADSHWLELQGLAQVEFTSEDAAHPIESALTPGSGWRAAVPGEQVIRLIFDEPQTVSRIHLLFLECEIERTQEFVLRWSPDWGKSYSEIVRQQYNFSPPGSTREVEDYSVNLEGVTALELRIVPEIGGGDARASLDELRIA